MNNHHTHIAMVPDAAHVNRAGLIQLRFTDSSAHGSTCDSKGQTLHRVDGERAFANVSMFGADAAKLAADIVAELSDAERATFDARVAGVKA